MSREVRRVPENFDAPLRKVWAGYVQPDKIRGHPCPHCDNGLTSARAWLDHLVHLLLMLDSDRFDQTRGRDLHPWLVAASPGYGFDRPSADIAELGLGLAERPADGPFGHDAIDRFRAVEKIVTAAGLPDTWGYCAHCKGNAWEYDSPEQQAASEAWEPTEPPTGDWWQLWETVSEGSPVTPAFASAEELATHLHENPGVVGPFVTSYGYEQAMTFITGPGWAPSGFITAAGVENGVVAMSKGATDA